MNGSGMAQQIEQRLGDGEGGECKNVKASPEEALAAPRCDSTRIRTWIHGTGGRTDPECSNLTARLPVVHAMQAGADLITCSTKTSSGM